MEKYEQSLKKIERSILLTIICEPDWAELETDLELCVFNLCKALRDVCANYTNRSK